MEQPVLTLGDLDTDVALTFDRADGRRMEEGGGRPRAVLTFADLRTHTRQSGRDRLRALAALTAVKAKRHAGIRHVVFAVLLSPRHAGGFDRIASALGARLHADLERGNARDVEITFLDVTACGDAEVLTERLRERCDDPVGQHGVVVLDWDDIRSHSIRRAARDQYL